MRRFDLFIILSAIYIAPILPRVFAIIASIGFAILAIGLAFLPEQSK